MNKSNRLINEHSPYLLQHSGNPVDWYPWCNEAFEKAKKENKPVFLSIGYSTCHWCHVMEHESFEDLQVAEMMNQTFINIKVDREERPDIDAIYMQVCQLLTGSGGWPLTIIMTPEKKPFFAGTYFPKQSYHNRIGMINLIPRIKELWKIKYDDIIRTSETITSRLNQDLFKPEQKLDNSIFDTAFRNLTAQFDSHNGGFSPAPKFPMPFNMLFLLRYYKSNQASPALSMVEHTLLKMRDGGIFDQIGGGFHRYSTDEKWLVPHFEKMLYDQAQLAMAYTEAYQITKKVFYKQSACEILDYVLSDMTAAEGGFYSAEDADSEGVEGKFYVWTLDEIRKIIPSQYTDLFIAYFSIDETGNFHDPHNPNNGNNILHISKSLEELSTDFEIDSDSILKIINECKDLLYFEREKRIKPGKDDKVLTDWNGLMIASLARAGSVFGEEKYISAAVLAFDFFKNNLVLENGNINHRWRNGNIAIEGMLDDYAFMAYAALELYEAVYDTNYLLDCINLTNQIIDKFYDNENGGFFFSIDNNNDLIVRRKEFYDGAEPSGSSIMMTVLAKLAKITSKPEYNLIISKTIDAFTDNVFRYPSGYTAFLCGLYLAMESNEIVIVGDRSNPVTKRFINLINENYLPFTVKLVKDSGKELTPLDDIAEFTKTYQEINGKPAAYICNNYSCKQPVMELNILRENLNQG